jgi:hypothetical protein
MQGDYKCENTEAGEKGKIKRAINFSLHKPLVIF